MGGGLYIYSKGEWHRSAWRDNDWIWIFESANNLWHILNAEKSLLIGKLVTRDLDGRGAPWCELKLFDCLWEESSWKRNPKCHQEFKSGRFTEPLNCGVSQRPNPDQRKALAVHKEMTLTGDASYTYEYSKKNYELNFSTKNKHLGPHKQKPEIPKLQKLEIIPYIYQFWHTTAY